MGERKGTKGLELWCRRMTEGYPGVNVTNMTTSWRDGLAFCAIIHHFRPDLIEFSKLHKDDIYYNNELAFRTAERHLGIPALLEPEDMVEFPVPDRLSILTYLSQFYQTFVVSQGKSPSRIAPKRPATTPDHGLVSPASTSPPTKVPTASAGGKLRREPCAKCALPVFIAERLNVGKLLYHRTCFRCARCNSQLTLANYYETENGEFCCEICPDEYTDKTATAQLTDDKSVLNRSLSDEEKSASLKKTCPEAADDYSLQFETALDSATLARSGANSQSTKARSFFMSAQVESATPDDVDKDKPPDLPKTAPPPITASDSRSIESDPAIAEERNKQFSASTKADLDEEISGDTATTTTKFVDTETDRAQSIRHSDSFSTNPNTSELVVTPTVNIDQPPRDSDSLVSEQQLAVASINKKLRLVEKSQDVVTKEDTVKMSAAGEHDDTTSIVQARMRLFERGSVVGNRKSENDIPPKEKPEQGSKSDRFSVSAGVPLPRTRSSNTKRRLYSDDAESVPSSLSSKSSKVDDSSSQQEEQQLKENIDSNISQQIEDTKQEIILVEDVTLEKPVAEIGEETTKDDSVALEDATAEKLANIPGGEIKQDATEVIDIGEDASPVIETSDILSISSDSNSVQILSPKEVITTDYSELVDNRLNVEQQPDVIKTPIGITPTGGQHVEMKSPAAEESAKLSEQNEPEIVDKVTSPHPVDERKVDEEATPEQQSSVIVISSTETSPIQLDRTEILKSPSSPRNDETLRKEVSGIIDTTRTLSEPAKTNAEEDYPDDLNPFGDVDEEHSESLKNAEPVRSGKSLNPFGSDDDDDEINTEVPPKPAARKNVKPSSVDKNIPTSTNPFEDDDDDDEPEGSEDLDRSPEMFGPASAKKLIKAPKISLTPFWNENAKGGEDRPVPKPRTSKSSTNFPEPRPRESGLSISSSIHGSSSASLSSATTQSSSGYSTIPKKKKPAPKPPPGVGMGDSGPSSLGSSPSHSVTHSPKSTPKIRKAKKAPAPPTSTPLSSLQQMSPSAPSDLRNMTIEGDEYEKEKYHKDEVNRNKQSQNFNVQSPTSSEDNSVSLSATSMPNKSTYGKWKRRKGQAPSRPIPQRRTIRAVPLIEVRRELDLIEIQQQGLEKQGVRLEQMIREKCEGPNSYMSSNASTNSEESSSGGCTIEDTTLPPEVEDLVLQLFELVNEKNELFRKQAELMYLRRQHRLEEEHADVEYQIRCLMLQPEANKTDSDKAREEELINRLMEIVDRRNEIIECLEMDRVREAEEDDSINSHLTLYNQNKEHSKSPAEKDSAKKEKKKHKKDKKFKLLKPSPAKVDADKDIDESESPSASPAKVKEKKKKKFNIF